MKKIIVSIIGLALVFSCNSTGRGGAVGKGGVNGEIDPLQKSTKWVPERPKGMVAIPSGSFVLGQSDFDFTFSPTKAPLRTVTVSAFYMDDAEVTNAKYRFFVNYVKDSIARTKLAEKVGDAEAVAKGAKGTTIQDYAYLKKSDNDKKGGTNAYLEYIESQGSRTEHSDAKKLNWKIPLHWNTNNYPDVEYAEVMEELYYKPEERFEGERTLDVRNLKYAFSYEDKIEAVKTRGRGQGFNKKESVMIYPDTTVWVRDFNYSHNEPMFEQYFWHKAFNEYPVVGVTFDQARAYCAFRTKFKNDYNQSMKKKKGKIFSYRLPTETEWEYAARGGLEDAPYPWGGPYLIDDRGCYLANFKPKRGDYIENEKGYLYTAKVKTFNKNGYGLYDMAGNVSEWTVSPFNNASYLTSSTINPYLGNKMNDPVKVIRGGSWKDVGYMLMVGYRDSENKDSARSYIGFRCVQTIPESADLKIINKKKKI